jgi:hypothetical protein
MKFNSSVLAALGALVMVSACAKTNEVANSIGGQTDKQVKELAIRAKWATSCNKAASLADLFHFPSQVEKYDMGASLQKTTTLFHEDNCAQPAITIVENGSYNLGDKAADNVYALNEKFDSVAITPVNDEGMKALNSIAACGFTDWTVGKSKDVTANSSDTPVITRCWVKTPRQIFDLASITGDKLTLGLVKDGRDKTDASKRPTEIDQAMVLSKQ